MVAFILKTSLASLLILVSLEFYSADLRDYVNKSFNLSSNDFRWFILCYLVDLKIEKNSFYCLFWIISSRLCTLKFYFKSWKASMSYRVIKFSRFQFITDTNFSTFHCEVLLEKKAIRPSFFRLLSCFYNSNSITLLRAE